MGQRVSPGVEREHLTSTATTATTTTTATTATTAASACAERAPDEKHLMTEKSTERAEALAGRR